MICPHCYRPLTDSQVAVPADCSGCPALVPCAPRVVPVDAWPREGDDDDDRDAEPLPLPVAPVLEGIDR